MLLSTRRRILAAAALAAGVGLARRKAAAQEGAASPPRGPGGDPRRSLNTVGSWQIVTWGVTSTAKPAEGSLRVAGARLPGETGPGTSQHGGSAELVLEYVYNRPPERSWDMKLTVSESRGGMARFSSGGGRKAVIVADGEEVAALETDKEDKAVWDPRRAFGPRLAGLATVTSLSAKLIYDGQGLVVFDFAPKETERALNVMVAEANRIGRTVVGNRPPPAAQSGGNAGGPGQCFVTTACCGMVGLADDCFELTALRRFRDRVLAGLPGGRDDIAAYYRLAPAILAEMARRGDERRLLGYYFSHVLPSALLAHAGANWLTHRLYRDMMRRLTRRYIRRYEPLDR